MVVSVTNVISYKTLLNKKCTTRGKTIGVIHAHRDTSHYYHYAKVTLQSQYDSHEIIYNI